MSRRIVCASLVLLLAGASAEAQVIFAGSTPEGDYLRGVGVAAAGMGAYNEKTAVANQINAQTFIMLNEYIWGAYKQLMQENAEHRRAMLAKHAEAYRKIQERIRNNPDVIDEMKGDALNNQLRQLWDPKVHDSISRSFQVPIDPGLVRRIPFKLGEKGETFSMARLSLRSILKGAVAFQDPNLAPLCVDYQRTVENALDLAMENRMTDQTIKDIEDAFDRLEDKFMRTGHVLDPRHQLEFSEAKQQLDKMRRTPRLFQTASLQPIFKELDNYTGTTVDELKLFMRKHNLNFAPAETPDERDLYPRLYTALVEQRKKATGEQ